MPMLNITRTITESIPLVTDTEHKGLTLGQQIDNHVRAAIAEGHIVQTVAMEFEREEWFTYAHGKQQEAADSGYAVAWDDKPKPVRSPRA